MVVAPSLRSSRYSPRPLSRSLNAVDPLVSLLVRERSERHTLSRSSMKNAIRIYVYVIARVGVKFGINFTIVKLLASFTGIYILDIVPRIVATGIKLI